MLEQIQAEWYGLCGHPGYPEILKKLTRKALGYLEGEGSAFICRVNERDRAYLSFSFLEQLGKDIRLDSSCVDIVGGVIVYRSDFRVLYDNSLEAIFERNRQHMRCIAAECIFGKE